MHKINQYQRNNDIHGPLFLYIDIVTCVFQFVVVHFNRISVLIRRISLFRNKKRTDFIISINI